MNNLAQRLALILTLVPALANCQAYDTANLMRNLKMELFSDFRLGIMTDAAMSDYIERDLKVTPLNSRGFRPSLLFYKIERQLLATDTLWSKDIIKKYSTPFCLGDTKCYYIVCFDARTGEFYKLKGTKQNDFDELYYLLQDWADWKSPGKIKTSTVKLFLDTYWVDSLDLNCLMESLRKKRAGCLDVFYDKIIVN